MPISQTAASAAASAVLAAAFLAFMPVCFADEVESSLATAAAPSATHGLFSSWFGTKAAKTQAAPIVDSDDEEAEAPRPIVSITGTRPSELVVGALGLLGIAYRLGGNSPTSGFDCSGLVRYVFQTAAGLDLPRRAEEISRVGTKVDRSELRPGDLVFYKTLRKTFSHVGIYLGDNRFIHAPSSGGAVRVDDMTQSYWMARFNGARRIGS
jgi:cell wall-associated NlpC family hydrolase